jgi:hypothetical protein
MQQIQHLGQKVKFGSDRAFHCRGTFWIQMGILRQNSCLQQAHAPMTSWWLNLMRFARLKNVVSVMKFSRHRRFREPMDCGRSFI